MRDKNFPIIAIVIDDLGMQLALTERAIGLDPFVTLAFLPYASDVVSQVALARSAGHEVLLHMPMEPLSGSNDPGPNALYVDLEFREMLRRLRWAFDQIPHAVGLNNHMGSKFTADENAMATVIGEMKSRDLIFL
ncbi:MAG TPA: divergent polysaccharide deacetylase family protein, partial [Alphaproteobacteria bacterium]|nr:divergent polysaccharide deacetylase family protein [Alphaproteobacteria bacterium]